MRRPSPIPAAPRGDTSPADDDGRAREDTVSAQETDLLPPPRRERAPGHVPTAPPVAAPGADASDAAGPGDRDLDAATSLLDEPDAGAPDVEASTPVGVRDVWAAARARRKALRAEVRRFTARQRRRRMVWLGSVGALVLLVLGSLGAAYSPLFAVEKVSVIGTQALDADAVAQALSGQLGTPLPRVDSSAVKAALVQFPLVESYTLEARPPHELVVRIIERTPIGAISSAAGYTLVDAAGVALSTTPQPPEGHPLITVEGGVRSPAFEAVGTVFRSLPEDIRAQVTAMTATSANDVTLTLGGTGTQVVWGNADLSQKKAIALAAAMTARPPDGVSSYDISSPEAVVIR